MQYIAFHNGSLLPDNTLNLIIDQARRGLITESAKKLVLYPDKRYGPADVNGMRLMHSVKKREGMTLRQVVRKSERKPNSGKKRSLTP